MFEYTKTWTYDLSQIYITVTCCVNARAEETGAFVLTKDVFFLGTDGNNLKINGAQKIRSTRSEKHRLKEVVF